MADYQRHRNADGTWCKGVNCANHRTKRNPGPSAFDRLEKKIERSERKAHPSYGKARVKYIAKAAAGKVAREKRR